METKHGNRCKIPWCSYRWVFPRKSNQIWFHDVPAMVSPILWSPTELPFCSFITLRCVAMILWYFSPKAPSHHVYISRIFPCFVVLGASWNMELETVWRPAVLTTPFFAPPRRPTMSKRPVAFQSSHGAVADLNDNSGQKKEHLKLWLKTILLLERKKHTSNFQPQTPTNRMKSPLPSSPWPLEKQWNINLNGSQREAWCSADWRAANVLGANCALMASRTFSKQQNPWTMKRHICTNSASQCLSYMFQLVSLKT